MAYTNPYIQSARQRDPRYAYAQQLMQQGSSAAPVQSPAEALIRALQGGVGGYFQGRVENEYKQKDADYQKALAGALASDDPITALGQSGDPYLMGMGLEGKLQQALNPSKDPLVEVFDPNANAMIYKPQSEAIGQQASAPEQIAPSSGIAKIQYDLANGFITPQQAQDAIRKETYIAPQQPREDPLVEVYDPATNAMVYKRRSEAEGLPSKAPGGGDTFKSADTLRDEYNALTKDFRVVEDAYSKIKATSDTGAGDMSLLYSYVKLLDPGSVVRESEFATAAASGSFGEQVQGAVQRLMTGERLPTSLRDAFKAEAETIYRAQKQGADRLKAGYTDIAKRYGVDPANVIVNYAAPPGVDPTLSPERQLELETILGGP